MKLGEPVEIEWVDSTTFNSWDGPHAHASHELTPIRSVGYLLAQNARQIILVQSKALDEGMVSDSLIIPRGCVRKTRRLIRGQRDGRQRHHS